MLRRAHFRKATLQCEISLARSLDWLHHLVISFTSTRGWGAIQNLQGIVAKLTVDSYRLNWPRSQSLQERRTSSASWSSESSFLDGGTNNGKSAESAMASSCVIVNRRESDLSCDKRRLSSPSLTSMVSILNEQAAGWLAWAENLLIMI